MPAVFAPVAGATVIARRSGGWRTLNLVPSMGRGAQKWGEQRDQRPLSRLARLATALRGCPPYWKTLCADRNKKGEPSTTNNQSKQEHTKRRPYRAHCAHDTVEIKAWVLRTQA